MLLIADLIVLDYLIFLGSIKYKNNIKPFWNYLIFLILEQIKKKLNITL